MDGACCLPSFASFLLGAMFTFNCLPSSWSHVFFHVPPPLLEPCFLSIVCSLHGFMFSFNCLLLLVPSFLSIVNSLFGAMLSLIACNLVGALFFFFLLTSLLMAPCFLSFVYSCRRLVFFQFPALLLELCFLSIDCSTDGARFSFIC